MGKAERAEAVYRYLRICADRAAAGHRQHRARRAEAQRIWGMWRAADLDVPPGATVLRDRFGELIGWRDPDAGVAVVITNRPLWASVARRLDEAATLP